MKEQKTYRDSWAVKADEIAKMQKGKVSIKIGEIELEGTIGEAYGSTGDPNNYGSFEFIASPETKKKYPDYQIPTTFAAGEFDGIAGE